VEREVDVCRLDPSEVQNSPTAQRMGLSEVPKTSPSQVDPGVLESTISHSRPRIHKKPTISDLTDQETSNLVSRRIAGVRVAKMNAMPAPGSLWQEARTPEGRVYYFNVNTKATQWTKPEELMTMEEVCQSSSCAEQA
jgi:hypothetical protein